MVPSKAPAPDNSSRSRRWGGWRRGLIVCALLGAGFWMTRDWWLTQMARTLIYSDGSSQGGAVIAIAGRAGTEEGARLILSGSCQQFILVDYLPTRLEILGIVPSRMKETRRQIEDLGIPGEQVLELGRQVGEVSDLLAAISEELSVRPEEQIVLLVSEWQSRRVALKAGRLPNEIRQRLHIIPVDNPEIDAENWWKSRRGVRTIVSSGIQLFATIMQFGSESPYIVRTEEDFRRAGVGEHLAGGETSGR